MSHSGNTLHSQIGRIANKRDLSPSRRFYWTCFAVATVLACGSLHESRNPVGDAAPAGRVHAPERAGTRIFYAPVLIRFLNNGLAVFSLFNSTRFKTAAEATPVSEPSSPGMYAAGQFLCGGISLLFISSTTIALLQK